MPVRAGRRYNDQRRHTSFQPTLTEYLIGDDLIFLRMEMHESLHDRSPEHFAAIDNVRSDGNSNSTELRSAYSILSASGRTRLQSRIDVEP